MKLCAVVVIYNKTISESSTCSCLARQNDMDFSVVLYDNSTAENPNRDACISAGWTYLGGTGNRGLSAAYNESVSFIRKERNPDIILLLDDDSVFEESFITDLKENIRNNPDGDVFLPVVTAGGKILSPWIQRGAVFCRHMKTEKECLEEKTENLLAFNSGMAVSADVFSSVQYDERLFLDGIDISFLRRVRNCQKRVRVIPCRMEQKFSGREKRSFSEERERFSIYAGDMKTMFGAKKLPYSVIVGKRAVHLALRHRSPDFLKIMMKNMTEEQK